MLLFPESVIPFITTTLLAQHTDFQSVDLPNTNAVLEGPYLPSKCNKALHAARINVRPPQPQFGMFLHPNILEAPKVNPAPL